MVPMGTRSLKKEITGLLTGPNLDRILSALRQYPAKSVVNVLFSSICRSDEPIRWHAISAMGVTVARLADQDMEEARIIMRRLLWSLNDESGGIGWGAPESMAEIMHCHEGLAREYVHMLVSYIRPDGPELEQDGNFLEHEGLQRGVIWGLERLCDRRIALLQEKGVADDLFPYLASGDHVVRGLALKICVRIGVYLPRETLLGLSTDSSSFSWYHEGNFREIRIDRLAAGALEKK